MKVTAEMKRLRNEYSIFLHDIKAPLVEVDLGLKETEDLITYINETVNAGWKSIKFNDFMCQLFVDVSGTRYILPKYYEVNVNENGHLITEGL